MLKNKGFTLMEMLIVLFIIGMISLLAVPAILTSIPDYRLRSAAMDLYSAMQRAKMLAIKTNSQHAIFFDTAQNTYQILSDPGPDGSWTAIADNANPHPGPDGIYGTGDDIPELLPVDLTLGTGNIAYGNGNATTNATQGGGVFPGDSVSYNNNLLIFNTRGMLLNAGTTGYVYLSNSNNSCYAVATPTITGNIVTSKWYPSSAAWEEK